MKRTIACVAVLVVLAVTIAFSRPGASEDGKVDIKSETRNPWTGLELNNSPDSFQFVIVSDRTGGHRAKIFERAVARINLLQPEFVVSVGDLIEGGGAKKKEAIEAEWKEFDGYVKRLDMPFFYVPGNHDTAAASTDKIWRERLGRRWYHFRYRDVLFLCLNTDDPDREKGMGAPAMGKEQVEYAKKALADNKDVRWTFVMLHKPIWTSPNQDKRGWEAVEKALVGRNYNVFCGHVHRYRRFVRQGMTYYQLATTGGGSKVRGTKYGEFDQVVWVTMKKGGPVITHLLLDSILPDDLKVPESNEKGSPLKKVKTVPVRGVVYYKGAPVAGASVILRSGAGRRAMGGDALTEGDGSFVPSTYTPNDGLPPGKYDVGVTLRRPLYLPDGKPGPNLLPAKFAIPAKSGVTVEVPARGGDVVIDLK
jgi:hypothetical protein